MLKLLFLNLCLLCLVSTGICQGLEGPPVTVEEIQVRWTGPRPECINLRVTVANDSPLAIQEPISLELGVRGSAGEEWRRLKSWPDIERLPAYFRESRDYFPLPHQALDPALQSGHFELRAQARLMGGRVSTRVTHFQVEPGKTLSAGDDPASPVRVVQLTLRDTTPYYLSQPEMASGLGEVRVSAQLRNVSPAPVIGLLVRLRVETAAGDLLEEFLCRRDRLEPGEEFEFTPEALHNYSLAQLRARVLLEYNPTGGQ